MTTITVDGRFNHSIERRFFIDRYNKNKLWEVAYMKGAMLLKQYIKNIDGNYHLLGKGSRRNKKELKELGILEMEEITNIEIKENTND